MKRLIMVLVVAMGGVLWGCAMESAGNRGGIHVVFDGRPLIVDAVVYHQGVPVGRVGSSDLINGVTRMVIDLDARYDALKKNNLAVVAHKGRLHLATLSAYGQALPPDACINGFNDMHSYRWFKFRCLINNINLSAERRAQHLMVRTGRPG